jgi:hypothetical protein
MAARRASLAQSNEKPFPRLPLRAKQRFSFVDGESRLIFIPGSRANRMRGQSEKIESDTADRRFPDPDERHPELTQTSQGCGVSPPLERANTPKTATKKRIGPRAPVVPPR